MNIRRKNDSRVDNVYCTDTISEEVDAVSFDSQLKNRSRSGRRGARLPFSSLDPHHSIVQLTSPTVHRRFAPPGSIIPSSRLRDNIVGCPPFHRRDPSPSLFHQTRWTMVYRDYDARNDTKHHERQRLTNAGERGERKGDGDGGGGRSDTVVVVGSRYADTFAGCERPGQRRVNWRGVPSLVTPTTIPHR